MGSIVVGMDGSPGAARALRWAVRESEVRGWPVTAVTMWGHHTDERQLDDEDEAAVSDALAAHVVAELGADVATTVRRRVVFDRATSGLLDASKDADLLVVGARGVGGFRGLLLGSVSQAVLLHATCPVAVVRERVEGPTVSAARIIVGVDGSSASQVALDWALDEARARQVSIGVVHGWQMVYGGAAYPSAYTPDPTLLESSARAVIEHALAAADTSGLIRPPDQLTVVGGAASALLEASRGADLVVAGSRGLGGFRGMLLGSVSHQIAQHASCPVVVVPEPG